MELNAGAKMEMNFVVKKFNELPEEDREKIYAFIKSKDFASITEVGLFLLLLLLKNLEEMARFAGPFDLWAVFPDDGPHKAVLFLQYFRENLNKREGSVYIEPVV